jgi:mannitol operon transcriptional antiterminator
VYKKTREAAQVLEEDLGLSVPPNEVTFFQIHFLAALASLEEKNTRRRVLKAGIVCVAGIGTSYMLAYQIRQRFKGELEVEISGYDEKPSWAGNDFLISTIALEESDKPCVLVQTMLGNEDYQKIQEAINAYGFTERGSEQAAQSTSLKKRLENLEQLFRLSRLLLDSFSLESIKADCSFEKLARFAAARFSPENPEAVYKSLMVREALVTQVIGELEIVLLHTRSAYNVGPVFAVIMPEGGKFSGEYFKNARSCVFMQLPEKAPRELTEIMGGISSALIDMPHFLEAIREGKMETIKAVLETEIAETLVLYCNEKLKE